MRSATTCDPDELLELVRVGDLLALDRMTRCFGDRLLWYGRRYCRSEEEAHDAVQDAMVAAGEHLQDYRGDGSLEGWLIRMVAHACNRMRRGRKNDPHLHEVDVDLRDESDSPEARTWRGEVAELLGEVLLELSPDDRLIVLLAEAEGWTGPQIAAETGLSHGAVRARLSRARKRLRSALEGRLQISELPRL